MSIHCKTEWSWESRTWSHKMNLLDILSTSPHYFCRKWIEATAKNSNFDLGVKRVKINQSVKTPWHKPIMGVAPTLRYGLCSDEKKFFHCLRLRLLWWYCIALHWHYIGFWFTGESWYTFSQQIFFIVNACDCFDDIALHCTSINSVFDLLESLATLFSMVYLGLFYCFT